MANEPKEGEEVEDAPPDDAELDGKLSDAEVFLRHAWDLLDDLAEAKRLPRRLVDDIEELLDEVVELLPE